MNSITALAHALDAKDSYTNGHSERVSRISVSIGKELKLTPELIDKIRIAGLIHDIGKIGIPESILRKPAGLTAEEFRVVQSHCEIGERILRPVVDDEDILKMVRYHHERCDGKGYPDGLVGDAIPVGARIICVADSYDAMSSDRPYRKSMAADAVKSELEKNRATQFDAEAAQTIVKMMVSGALS